jgi:hypothetical protein
VFLKNYAHKKTPSVRAVAETTAQTSRSDRAGAICDYRTPTVYPTRARCPKNWLRAEDNIQELHSWQERKHESIEDCSAATFEPRRKEQKTHSTSVPGVIATV